MVFNIGKKGKKKKKKAIDENLPPPKDPLDELTPKQKEMWKDLFEMVDIDKKGTLNTARVVEIMSEMQEGKIDVGEIEELVKAKAVKKEEGEEEDSEARVNFSSFL